ncbi:uncharacterized protein DS421_19g673720 [Arachis hypogaea]|uniref:Secreted protein n=1 Tax=Arachis hypogaea TaxID=3818 RepID=A0A6B9VD75_ARAHY|nr:uncharacterized protein DS421_19g673720 [Arachis hypogaea]
MVLFSVLLICLRKKIGAGVVRASCFLRYNTSIFYDPSAPALSPLPQEEVQSPSLSLNPSSAPSPQGT